MFFLSFFLFRGNFIFLCIKYLHFFSTCSTHLIFFLLIHHSFIQSVFSTYLNIDISIYLPTRSSIPRIYLLISPTPLGTNQFINLFTYRITDKLICPSHQIIHLSTTNTPYISFSHPSTSHLPNTTPATSRTAFYINLFLQSINLLVCQTHPRL